MKRADRLNARYVLIAGDNELNQGAAVLRNMKTREQTEIPFDSLAEIVKKKIQHQ